MTMVKPNAGVILLFSNAVEKRFVPNLIIVCMLTIFRAEGTKKNDGGVVGESRIKNNGARSISKNRMILLLNLC